VIKARSSIPDPRLVTDGYIILDMKYTNMSADGKMVQNVSDILFETKIDPFMSLLKNSSASETIGEFTRTDTAHLLSIVGSTLAQKMGPELPSQDSFMFLGTKGDASLRNMAAAIDGNTVNSILFPTYRGALGFLEGAESSVQSFLSQRGLGNLRSKVFYLDIRDAGNKRVTSFNGAPLFVKALYKGQKTSVNDINVVVAEMGGGKSIRKLAASDILDMQHASDLGDGYVIFKTSTPGYFVVTDK
jgi:hypothetical protein